MENVHLTDEQIQNYFDGVCEANEKIFIKGHLQTCADCKKELEKLTSIDQIIKAEFKITPLSFNLSDKVAKTIFKREKRPVAIPAILLHVLLILSGIVGAGYCLNLSLHDSSIMLILTVMLSLLLYFFMSYSEIRKLQIKSKMLA
ncbi:MAG TPA: zf-HC2 domain-containing protein [Chitinophagaceae bacterium]|nr:zf-HC2 domain-containing protein [Chitinophagaceae bacterium]